MASPSHDRLVTVDVDLRCGVWRCCTEPELRPTKFELLPAWLTGRSWHRAQANADLVRVASVHFNDPEGLAGISARQTYD